MMRRGRYLKWDERWKFRETAQWETKRRLQKTISKTISGKWHMSTAWQSHNSNSAHDDHHIDRFRPDAMTAQRSERAVQCQSHIGESVKKFPTPFYHTMWQRLR
jgi:hypothetical protein